MRLKQLRLSGFKSFCDDMSLSFQENGISVIVGPNGCGKSNVVDAIRWALGEQSPRFLRGDTMSDIIFNGSISRKPINRAEVTIVFDNTQGLALEKYRSHSEISVTRRLYRSGESDYLINNTPCRLLDIRELVMDTGAAGRSYSIVEQGKVDQFITNSPAERRVFLEEAAGIVRYKTKRQAAEKRLEQTRQNLLRVADVLGELSLREEALRDQVDKARAYLDLRDEVARLGLRLNQVRHHKSRQKHDALVTERQQAEESLAQVLTQAQSLQALMDRLDTEKTMLAHALRDQREEVHARQVRIQEGETRLALSRQQQENLEQWMERLEDTLGGMQKDRLRLEENLQAQRQQTQSLEQEETRLATGIAQEEARWNQQEALRQGLENQTRAGQEQMLACHTHLTGISNQLSYLQEKAQDWTQRQQSLTEQIARTQGEQAQTQSMLARAQGQQAQNQAARQAAQQAMQALTEALASKEEERRQARQVLQQAEKQALEIQSRLDTLREIDDGYEGFAQQVRQFLQWVGDRREAWGIVGPLADHLRLADGVMDWAGALLAPYLELIVVRQGAQVAALEEQMAAQGLGGVRFVALDHQPQAPTATGPSLADLVTLPPAMAPLQQRLFGSIRLLPAQSALHPPPTTLGAGQEWLAQDGRFYYDHKAVLALGRAPSPTLGVLHRRKEMEDLQQRLHLAQQAVAAHITQQERLDLEATQLSAQRQEASAQCSQLELEARSLSLDQEQQEREAARLKGALERLTDERTRLDTEQEQARQQQIALETARLEWEEKKAALEKELTESRKKETLAREEAHTLGQALGQQRMAHVEVKTKLQNTLARLSVLEKDVEELAHKRQDTQEELARQRTLLAQAVLDQEQLSQELDKERLELETRRRDLAQDAQAHDEREAERMAQTLAAKQIHQELDQLRERLSTLEVALAEERLRMQQHQELLGDAPPEPLSEEEIDEGQLETRWSAGRRKLERMENVNLAAPEEYQALTTRLGDMGQQKADLEKACHDLEESIRQMNQESRRRFKETFDQVNEKFQGLFPQVFGGGQGRLVLTDSEDVLLAGVDIEAEPPGKKISGLNLLSGGEKALTAIALIFSFFLIKPSPFCLLDEVDAPLDDANVGRFNRLVQSVMARSQFIIITHNRRTMEIGDVLYGITMEEDGVSKVVSVNLAEHAAPGKTKAANSEVTT